MPDWLAFILAVLATYRVAHMIALEDGPFDVFSWMREKVGQEYWYGRGMVCVLCLSFWISLPAALLTELPVFLGWFGIAGGVTVLHLVLEAR